MRNLHFTLPSKPNEGVAFNSTILDVWLGKTLIGAIIQTRRNLPEGASTDRFYVATREGVAIPETDSYTLTACLCKLDDCLNLSCPPALLIEAMMAE